MPVTTDDILKKARELGDLIGQHPAAKKLEDVLTRLQADIEAQRAMTDYNRHLQVLGEKEAAGKPIEVGDKRKLDDLQKAVVRNRTLSDFQLAQMDYLDLMRKVDEAIEGAAPGGGGAGGAPAGGAGAGPMINPAFDFTT